MGCPNEDGSKGPLINACYIWLPIHFHANSVTMEYNPAWDLDDPFAPAPLPGVTCEVSKVAAAGKPVALATCQGGLASQVWQFKGTGSQAGVLSMSGLCL